MSRVEQLEALKELRAWFERYDAEVWDRKIENDSKNGKLRRMVDQALADDRAGRLTEFVNHRASPDFWVCYRRLPKRDPRHPSLQFKKLDEVWPA